jgi:Kef-type K+ transport system membrane component KefB/nucleotide-binding universal stress UspA family protein
MVLSAIGGPARATGYRAASSPPSGGLRPYWRVLDLPTLPLQTPGWIFAVLMAVVLVVPLVAERARIPPVVALLLAGTVVGPNAVGLLEREGTLAVLGSAGLLYLMFMVGLELDLQEFADQRMSSLIFGALTFAFPMVIGTVAILAMGFDTLPAVLLASCWASHTLLAYPVYHRYGTHGHPSVATAVGGTILTDTAALIVLVVVVRAYQGVLDVGFWLTLVPSLAALLATTLWMLPRLGRWFFAGIGQDRGIRFLFVMVALFASGAIAHAAGIEAIIGAFLAGIGLNRLVPNGSQLMDRVQFLGWQVLIPVFLVSVGMLVDWRLLGDAATLALAAGFTAVALSGKLVAALVTGRLVGYGRAEVGTLFSLSTAQAAATLAAVVIAVRVGLIGTEIVNAVVVVILVTCVLASWTADRYARRLPRPAEPRRPGSAVVVAVARPDSAGPLLRLAAALARRDGGRVLPLVVVPAEDPAGGFQARRAQADAVERLASRHGVEAHALVRIDSSPAEGVLHTAVEHGATLVVMGWKGRTSRREARLGGVIDTVTGSSTTPVLVARLRERPPSRVLLLVPDRVHDPAEASTLRLAIWTTARLAAENGLDVQVLSATDDPAAAHLVRATLGVDPVFDARRPAVAIRDAARTGDLVILPGGPEAAGFHGIADRVARAVPDVSVVVTVSGRHAVPGLDDDGLRREASRWANRILRAP